MLLNFGIIVIVYISFFVFFVLDYNLIQVNEEFYVSLGSLGFLFCVFFLIEQKISKFLNFILLDEFNNYLDFFWTYYKFFCKLLDFFFFELNSWRLLYKLYIYNYKFLIRKYRNRINKYDYINYRKIVYNIFIYKLFNYFYISYMYEIYNIYLYLIIFDVYFSKIDMFENLLKNDNWIYNLFIEYNWQLT